ncbi:SGNH/GDSL hydrolase family protein [Streptomyces sp. RB6PN25]|uniref:SGNH/GDSL hydrolase family protein n=1 Tax=Streptomyces humicola TaxID=2953240 RepID=A0ABT1PU55_9ACTN|nr:SGNH/GDSL hydrolase family protein [Streptomyces humicola]MCQ4080500.1 SGNH/GDSL hydrolase family protein [Streptomyces humicola]
MPMSRARVARRIAAAAAYGGGGIGLLGGAAIGLLLTEVQLARRVVGGSEDVPPVADGRYGAAFAHACDGAGPLRLAFLGDSTAAGQGVHRVRETPGALLASGLAAIAERPVDLVNVALPGAQSDDLGRQVGLLLDGSARPPDVCVIMIGANDVTHRMPPARSVRHLADAVRALRAAGAEVIVGTCPDLGTIEPVYQPLRWVARRLSRQLAAAQTIAVVELGGRTVSLGQLLGPEFEASPREMFGPDNYHPSATGYATAAMAVLPTLCAALGLWPEDERPDSFRGETILPVAQAAAEAAAEGGTEVAAAGPAGAPGAPTEAAAGRRGPWALLKHRRLRRVAAQEAPEPPAPQEYGEEHDGERRNGEEPDGEERNVTTHRS